jgi:uncharacterized protein (DUF2164 family)
MLENVKNKFENMMNKKVKDYLENNIEIILNSITDETICNFFDKAKNSIIESRHLKEEVTALKKANEELKMKLVAMEKNKG